MAKNAWKLEQSVFLVYFLLSQKRKYIYFLFIFGIFLSMLLLLVEIILD